MMLNKGAFIMTKKISQLILCLLFVIILPSCSTDKAEKGDKPQVYTSFYAMYDFAKQIAQDKADVYMLCPTGQEPHDFEPTAKDIANLSDADVFIYNGMGMEHWADSVIGTLEGSDVICVNTSDAAEDITEENDPHLWLNPENAYKQLEAITNALKSADEKNALYYDSRLSELKEKLDTLTDDYTAAINTFTSRDIVVSHKAYGNLCRAFSLNQIAINGISSSDDPSPMQMTEIEKYITENNIKYIFKEPLGSSSVVDAIANDTGCGVLVLDPFEGNTQNKDYFTVMYENLDSLRTALK